MNNAARITLKDENGVIIKGMEFGPLIDGLAQSLLPTPSASPAIIWYYIKTYAKVKKPSHEWMCPTYMIYGRGAFNA